MYVNLVIYRFDHSPLLVTVGIMYACKRATKCLVLSHVHQ